MDAGRAGIGEDVRRRRTGEFQHLPRHLADLPLGAVAAAQLEEVQKLAHVHGDDDLRLAGVGQKIARVLGGNARLHERPVGLGHGGGGLVEEAVALGIGGHGGGLHHGDVALELHVALGLLVEAGDAMAHQLVRERAGHAVDGEGVAGVLKRGEMPRAHDGGKHAAHPLGRHGLHQLTRAHRRIAQPRRRGDGALGVGRMVQKLYLHNVSSHLDFVPEKYNG